MTYLRLMKYPGAKTTLLPEIRNILRNSNRHFLLDVFGGSGLVALNLHAKRIVYNDIEEELVNLFRVIQERPESLYQMLETLLKSAGENRSRLNKGFSGSFTRNEVTNTMQRGIPARKAEYKMPEARQFRSTDYRESSEGLSMEKRAYYTIYRFSTSFGGMGNTYATTNEKSTFRYISKTLDEFPRIAETVKKWKIENLDFRELIPRYDSRDAFFYLDPPYPGKGWYNHNFDAGDFEDIRTILESLKGKYLMNLNAEDTNLAQIFGKPTFVKSYINQNGGLNVESGSQRLKAFYTNVQRI